MKLMIIIGFLGVFGSAPVAEAQNWECRDMASGRVTITNAPASDENLTCLLVNNNRVAFNKVDPKFFEAYIKEAEARKEALSLLGLRHFSDQRQEERVKKREKKVLTE